jgi:hypothetical protein
MLLAIVTGLLPFALKILGSYFTNKAESEAAKAFLRMVGSMELGGERAVKLHDSFRDQIEEIKRRHNLEEENARAKLVKDSLQSDRPEGDKGGQA